jgi:hypothetical protein
MGLYQILPFVMLGVVGFVVFIMTKSMKASAGANFEATRKRLAEAFNSIRQPGETEAAFVGMGSHKLMNNRQFYAALTEKRLLLDEPNGVGPLRAYDRNAVSISAQRKKWTDTGNTQTVVSHGWEVDLALPDGEKHTLRLYESNAYDPGQAMSISTFLQQLGVS